MNRFPPRFMQPVMPEMAPPLGNVQFRPPQGNGLKLGGGGGSSETTGPGRPQQQGGGGGMGGAMGLGGLGLLSKVGLGGPQATSVMDPGFALDAASWGSGAPTMGGLLGSASMGPEGITELGLAASGANPLALSNPATAALAAPGLLNMMGMNIPNPVSWITDRIGGLFK